MTGESTGLYGLDRVVVSWFRFRAGLVEQRKDVLKGRHAPPVGKQSHAEFVGHGRDGRGTADVADI